MPDDTIRSNSEVVLIGAGIMSATLGVILKELQPDIKIEIYEIKVMFLLKNKRLQD